MPEEKSHEPGTAADGIASWRGALRGNVWWMGMVSLVTDLSSEMMNPLLPIFIAGLVGGKWAAFWVGLTEGVAEATASLLKIFSGRISDRLKKRKLLVLLGYGLSSLARPLMSLAGLALPAFAGVQIVGLKFADRVGKGIRTSPRDALIGDSVDPRFRGLAFSFHRAMDHAGAVIGPLTAGLLLYLFIGQGYFGPLVGAREAGEIVPAAEMAALRWIFALALIPGLAAMAILALRVKEIVPAAPETGLAGDEKRRPRLPARFHAFVGIAALFALGNSSDMFLLLYGWMMLDLSLPAVLLLWIALHLSKIIFSMPGGVFSDRFGRRPLIIAGWIVYAFIYLGMASIGEGSAWLFCALFIGYGFFYGMTEGVERALVADFTPSRDRGRAYGLYHGVVGLAALPASLLFGVFWTAIGPRAAFGIGAGLAFLAAALLAWLLASAGTRPKLPDPR